ncbi:MAG: 8-oxoguanine deaminase [Geodermatophilaceae bacterium]|nr:8-oxoguanine deaminase [Geodermatophilaceae bacterium]
MTAGEAAAQRTVIEGCAVATVDVAGTQYAEGHVVADDGVLVAVGVGPAPAYDGAEVVDGRGCLATPGLVNTHHHLYQWLTRGCAPDSTLFEWLVELYPVWARIDAEAVHDAAAAGLGWLALSGCTISMDHHYVFPADRGDLLAAEIEAAQSIGVRFHPARGSMDLGESQGGLPPDRVVEDIDTILKATAAAIDEHHDPSPGSMTQIAVAPCSPFSVTTDLLRQAAALARDRGVRLHTHLCETLDEEAFCREKFGTSPTEYVEQLGWLGPDVWLAHGIHFDDDAVRRLAGSGTGVAHCPSSNGRLGAGIARVKDLLAAGVPVGLGVDGPASNEHGGLGSELRIALLVARLRDGPTALTGREVLRMATMGGAQCLGREADIGSLEIGKRADVALWDLTGLGHVDMADDPVTALVMGPPAPLRLLLVEGRTVVADGVLTTADENALGAAARAARTRLQISS